MTKTITLAVVLSALALAGGIAASHTALAKSIGLSAISTDITIGHGSEDGECGGDHDGDHDGDRC